jgi:hypothetical protein
MKLIRCYHCDDPVALSVRWRSCTCGASGGVYREDGDKAVVAGPCGLYGVSNLIFVGMRHEAWPYDEKRLCRFDGLPKITRLTSNPRSTRRALAAARARDRALEPNFVEARAQRNGGRAEMAA